MEKEKKIVVVSKCLLGYNCKYNGGNNYNPKVIEYLKDREYIMVCPECAGGLSTPRIPSERKGEKVINSHGEDVSRQFESGAKQCFSMIQKEIDNGKEIELAILKAKSPSCGYGMIYDGTFTSTLIEGNGVFGDLVDQAGIKIVNEKNSIFD